MKLKILAALGVAAALGACAHTLSPAQTLEAADTTANLAYVATAASLNVYEAAVPAQTASAEAIKKQAWAVLLQARAAYAEGKDITAFITQLNGFKAQAAALAATPPA